MKKVYIDCETTGVNSHRNGIVQLAMLIEDEDGKVVDKLNVKIRPFDECVYDAKALEINGLTEVDIKKYQSEAHAALKLCKVLDKHQVGKEHFEFCGYNSSFDMEFVHALLKRNGSYYSKYFSYYDVDTFALVKILGLTGKFEGKDSKKLVAICELMGVDLGEKAHDALADIVATRKLHKKLMKRYIK